MARTTLLLVRHGQSTWNIEHRWQGQEDPPLSPLGEAQAKDAGKNLGAVDAIYSSPLIRASATALTIAELSGIGPVMTVDGLIERNSGAWQGMTREEIYKDHSDWETTGYRPEGWEPDDQFLARVNGGLAAIADNHSGGLALVVSHSGVIMTLERHHDCVRGRVPNLSGIEITYDESADKPISVGRRIHLIDDQLSTGGSAGVASLEAESLDET